MDRPNLIRALGGGLIATLTITAFLFLASSQGYIPNNFFVLIGGGLTLTARGMENFLWWWGLIWHLNFGSIVFPHLYVLAFYPMFRGRTWVRGLQFGAVLWLFAMVIAMPLFGYGLFAVETEYPAIVATGVLILHLIYGAILGGIAGEPKEKVEYIRLDQSEAA